MARYGVGQYRHRVTLSNPGPLVPDGDGGWTTTPVPLNPATVDARISPATGADAERLAAGTVLSATSSIVAMRYHPQVTTQTTVEFNGRQLQVAGMSNPDERNLELILICDEVVD